MKKRFNDAMFFAIPIILCTWVFLFLSMYHVSVTPRTVQAMTKTQMQAVATGLTNAGFPAELVLNADGTTWKVRSRAPDFTVNTATVCAFTTAQGVTSFVAEVEYR